MIIGKNKNDVPRESKTQSVYESLWLTYYNDTLYAKGIITEEERNKMRAKINARAASKI